MKELDNTKKILDQIQGYIGSFQLLFDARSKTQEEIEETILESFKGCVKDAWFETNEDGSRQLYIKLSAPVKEIEIKVGGTE